MDRPPEVAAANRTAIESRVDESLGVLDTIITTDTAELQVVTAVRQLARIQRRTVRYLFNRLGEAE